MKRLALIILLITVALFVTACGSNSSDSSTGSQETTDAAKVPDVNFTLDELAKNNGQDGMPAYIAVDGIVYDVSAIPAWKSGQHNQFQAGSDYSDAIANVSPHGKSVLKKLTPVGKLSN